MGLLQAALRGIFYQNLLPCSPATAVFISTRRPGLEQSVKAGDPRNGSPLSALGTGSPGWPEPCTTPGMWQNHLRSGPNLPLHGPKENRSPSPKGSRVYPSVCDLRHLTFLVGIKLVFRAILGSLDNQFSCFHINLEMYFGKNA